LIKRKSNWALAAPKSMFMALFICSDDISIIDPFGRYEPSVYLLLWDTRLSPLLHLIDFFVLSFDDFLC